MNFFLKAGGCALILSPERGHLIGHSGQLVRMIEESWLILVDGARYTVNEKSLMPLDGFSPAAAVSFEMRKTA